MYILIHNSGGDILVGYKAAFQSDHNPENTVYDVKRFIGKTFSREEFESETARYPFQVKLVHYHFIVLTLNGHSINVNL